MKLSKLKKGDTVSLIAPAGAVFNEEYIQKSKYKLEQMGYVVKLGTHVYSKYGYLAGTDEERLEDLHNAFVDKEVKAIFCLRGGYGTIRLLSKINNEVINCNPKIFVGYSDITSLHSYISKFKFPLFHGPMFNLDLNKNQDNYNLMFNFLEGNIKELNYNLISLRNGNIEGEIVGGNLAVLCSLIGSKYLYDFKDKILFIEEINEEPYKIDRFIQQLFLSDIFSVIKGIILGEFTNCLPEDKSRSLKLDDIFNTLIDLTNVPIFTGLKCGHGYTNNILPFGVKSTIKDNKLIVRKEDVFND